MPAIKKNYKLNLINMDTKIKNYLGAGAVVSMIMLAISSLIFAGVYAKSVEPSSFRNFSVSGEGKITAVPDVAQFSFGIITEGGKNIAELQKENSQKANGAIEFLKRGGVKDKDIKTVNYNIQPRYQYPICVPSVNARKNEPCPPPEIVGYSVSQTIAVKAKDFNKISDLLAGVVQSGANAVSELSFVIDDKTEIENKTRQQAIENAIKKAESIAQAGRFNLGNILSINEEWGGISPRFSILEKSLAIGANDNMPAPEIEPGSQDITVKVSINYEIR